YVLRGISGGDYVGARWAEHRRWTDVSIPEISGNHGLVPWSFVPQGALPPRPSGTSSVQLLLESDAQPPNALTATGAVAYRPTTLAALFRLPDARPLVWPNLILYMP